MTDDGPVPVLPPVSVSVAAAALDTLPARLRKRVDGAVAKAAAWPVEATPEGVLVRVADDTAVTLRTTAGVVVDDGDAVCGCLLAPACLHRAAVLSRCPVAQDMRVEGGAVPDTVLPEGGSASPPQEMGPGITQEILGGRRVEPAGGTGTAGDGGREEGGPDVPVPTAVQAAALDALREAGTAVLVAGMSGAGAALRAELLHAAHSARLAGAHRPAGTAVRIAQLLGDASSDDPGFRLPALSAELAYLLDSVRRPADALAPARRSYHPEKPLRIHGLFTEPVVTASGYAGATVHTMGTDGVLRTLSDVAPGPPARAAQAASAPVPGGCALALREVGAGGGLVLTSATVSADGRIGGGSRVRSVRAEGAGWWSPPVAALWERSPVQQLAEAFRWLARSPDDRGASGDLLFLDGVVTEAGFAVTGGPSLRLVAPDERRELPYTDNLRLLSSRPGLAVRLVARAVRDRPGHLHALAAAWTGHDGAPFHADLGLRRLDRSHIPGFSVAGPAVGGAGGSARGIDGAGGSGATDAKGATGAAGATSAGVDSVAGGGPPPGLPVELDLLRRVVDRTVAGGRPVSAASAGGDLPRRLRSVGLSTGAEWAVALAEAAGARRHDALGRLLPADPGRFALAWLGAAVYTAAATESLLLAGWAARSEEG